MQYGLTIEAIIELFGEQICDCPRCKERRGAETDDEGNPLPPVYQDLDDVGQGLLWLAHHGNRRVQAWNNLERRWEDDEDDVLYPQVRYRVKPEGTDAAPAREPIKIKPNGPTLWRDMTDEEKGALLLAEHDGARIETWDSEEKFWEDAGFVAVFEDHEAYRVGSGSVVATREPIKIQGPSGEILGSGTMLRRDGEWDFDSIEVEDQ
jgi:hypothetical protein